MLTYIILALIVIYSGWVLYRSFKRSIEGKNCGSCTNCNISSSCNLEKKELNNIEEEK